MDKISAGHIQKPTVIYVNMDFGLTDTIRGAISIYKACKILGLQFKINIVEPLRLTDFLLPNNYDWRITQEEFDVAIQENNFCKFVATINDRQEVLDEIKAKCEGSRYLVVKNNVLYATENEYGELYDGLFKPVTELHEAINLHLRQIGGNFVSAGFRFMQLLGDFVEPHSQDFPVLEPSEQKKLIEQCLKHLEEIHKENPEKKILVTSDSISFLAAAQKLRYTYVVPGEIVHSGATQTTRVDNRVWMKYFLDYYLLKHSQKIYRVVDGLMYRSSVQLFAAWHGKIPHVLKNYNEIALEAAALQLSKILHSNAVNEMDEKEHLTRQALSALRATYWLCCKNSGLDVYEKLQDDESKAIYKELFYRNYVAAGYEDSALRLNHTSALIPDNCLNQCANFMSIDGSELNALRGAKETICSRKPKLAITISHKPEDMIDMPAFILQIVPEYKFYIRHCVFSDGDTVLYAIADNR